MDQLELLERELEIIREIRGITASAKGPKKAGMSAAQRAKLSTAMKKRWAERKKKKS